MQHDRLKADILADGVIDANEVDVLRKEIYADGVVDAAEMALLVALRNEADSTCEEFEEFFFEAAEKNLLADQVIDADEVKWLREVIFADGIVDDREKAFLRTLRDKAKSLDDGFATLFAECCPGE